MKASPSRNPECFFVLCDTYGVQYCILRWLVHCGQAPTNWTECGDSAEGGNMNGRDDATPYSVLYNTSTVNAKPGGAADCGRTHWERTTSMSSRNMDASQLSAASCSVIWMGAALSKPSNVCEMTPTTRLSAAPVHALLIRFKVGHRSGVESIFSRVRNNRNNIWFVFIFVKFQPLRSQNTRMAALVPS